MFKYFPKISYNFGSDGGTMDAVDIFKSINITTDNKAILKKIIPKIDQRPDQLSLELHNTTDYFWVLMLLNKINDPLHLWNNDLKNIVYLDDTNTEKIKNKLRDSTTNNINIKISEL